MSVSVSVCLCLCLCVLCVVLCVVGLSEGNVTSTPEKLALNGCALVLKCEH